MKKLAIILGALAITASAFAANTASISVTGTVTGADPTIENSAPAWAIGTVTVGEAIDAPLSSTITLTSPNATYAATDITISATVTGTWLGIGTITALDTAVALTAVDIGTSGTPVNIASTYRGATDGTPYSFTFAIKSGSVATSQGDIAGTIALAAIYSS